MTAVVVGSVRGAPGVTTVSLLMASCMAGAVAEADVDGGVLAARYKLGREPGLTTLAAARTRDPDEWRRHAQHAGAGGVPVLAGPDAPQHALGLWTSAGDELAASLAASSTRIVVDAGRIRPEARHHQVLLATAPLVLLLVRPVLDDLLGLTHRLPSLRSGRSRVAVVLVGAGRYGLDDVARQFDGIHVVGEVPWDRKAAALMERGGTAHGMARTRLARAVRSLTEEVVVLMGVPATGRPALMAPAAPKDRAVS